MDINSSHEVLDLLFDKEDPVLKDINSFIDSNEMDILKNLPSDLQMNEWSLDDNTFWNSFLKDMEPGGCTSQIVDNQLFSSSPETDSLSRSESLSPHSTYGSDNSESTSPLPSGLEMEGVTFSDLGEVKLLTSDRPTLSYSEKDSSCFQLPNSPATAIDIGADIVVVTSEMTVDDSSEVTTIDNSLIKEITTVKGLSKSGKSANIEESPLNSIILESPELLQLTDEERRLMKKEGVNIPTHLPLTKAEERELKRIRRKIRNKVSAQDSRKRKKQYMDGLETRVKLCTAQNIHLQKKVHILEKQNTSLVEQLKRLQKLLTSASVKPVQTSTCVMVVLLSFALLLIPNLSPKSLESKDLVLPGGTKMPPVSGRSRSLLYSSNEANDLKMLEEKALEDNISGSNAEIAEKVDQNLYTYAEEDVANEKLTKIHAIPDYTVHQLTHSNINNAPVRNQAGFLSGYNISDADQKVVVKLSQEF